MAVERDIAAELAALTPILGANGYAYVPVGLRDAAVAEILRLRAELDAGHKLMDRAGIARDHGGGTLELARRINLKLQALADMVEVRDDGTSDNSRPRQSDATPCAQPPCPSSNVS